MTAPRQTPRQQPGDARTAAPIRRRKLYEDVVARLEQLIHSEELKPGEALPSERDLMLQFGVGRPAIREALFALVDLARRLRVDPELALRAAADRFRNSR